MTDPRRPPIPPLAAFAFGILAVSTASILIRYAQSYQVPSLVIAACRLSAAALLLTPVAVTRRRAELAALTRADLGLGLLSGLFLTVHFATWITSLEYTSIASSVVFVTTTPLWVALLAPLALKEPLTRLATAGVGLAFVGGVVVGLSDSGGAAGTNPLLGDALALAGALAAAGYIVIGRKLRARLSLLSYIFVVYGVAALGLVFWMFAAGEAPWGYPPQAYGLFLLLAIVPQLMGHTTFNWALGYLPAAFVAVALMGEPVGSIILAYFLLGEAPGALKLFGAILIFVGIYVASLKPKALPEKKEA